MGSHAEAFGEKWAAGVGALGRIVDEARGAEAAEAQQGGLGKAESALGALRNELAQAAPFLPRHQIQRAQVGL